MVLPSDVDLSENQIGAAGLQALCTALALNPAVQKMQLGGNGLEEKAAQHLASLLLLHTGLRSLDLSYNELNDLAGNNWSGQSWVTSTHWTLMAGRGMEGHTQLLPEISQCWCLFAIPLQPHRILNSFQACLTALEWGSMNKTKLLTSGNIH